MEQASQIEGTVKKLRFFSYKNFKRNFLETILFKLSELIIHSIFIRSTWNFECIFLNSFYIEVRRIFAIFWKLLILYVIYHKIFTRISRRNFQMTAMLKINILEKSYVFRCIQACRLKYFFILFRFTGDFYTSSPDKHLFKKFVH